MNHAIAILEKYKKCCLNKIEDKKKYDIDDVQLMEMHNFINLLYIIIIIFVTKKVELTRSNKKLLNIYDNRNNMNIKII